MNSCRASGRPDAISVAGALDQLYSDHFACIAKLVREHCRVDIAASARSTRLGSQPRAHLLDGNRPRRSGLGIGSPGEIRNGLCQPEWNHRPWAMDRSHCRTTGACPVLTLQPAADGSASTFWIFRQVAPSGEQAFNGPVAVGSVAASANMFTDTDTYRPWAAFDRAAKATTRRARSVLER